MRQVKLNLQIPGSWIVNTHKKNTEQRWGPQKVIYRKNRPTYYQNNRYSSGYLNRYWKLGQSGFIRNVLILIAAALHLDLCLRRLFRILIPHSRVVQIKYINKPQIRITSSILVKTRNLNKLLRLQQRVSFSRIHNQPILTQMVKKFLLLRFPKVLYRVQMKLPLTT